MFAPVRPTLTAIFEQLRVRLLRRELERGRPPRELRGRPERLAQREVVDLDDDAVGVELERLPAVGPGPAELDDLVDAGTLLKVRFDRQSPLAQRLQDTAVVRAVREPPHGVESRPRFADFPDDLIRRTPPAGGAPPAPDPGCASFRPRRFSGWQRAARRRPRAPC